jgi:hypothetical protein
VGPSKSAPSFCKSHILYHNPFLGQHCARWDAHSRLPLPASTADAATREDFFYLYERSAASGLIARIVIHNAAGHKKNLAFLPLIFFYPHHRSSGPLTPLMSTLPASSSSPMWWAPMQCHWPHQPHPAYLLHRIQRCHQRDQHLHGTNFWGPTPRCPSPHCRYLCQSHHHCLQNALGRRLSGAVGPSCWGAGGEGRSTSLSSLQHVTFTCSVVAATNPATCAFAD